MRKLMIRRFCSSLKSNLSPPNGAASAEGKTAAMKRPMPRQSRFQQCPTYGQSSIDLAVPLRMTEIPFEVEPMWVFGLAGYILGWSLLLIRPKTTLINPRNNKTRQAELPWPINPLVSSQKYTLGQDPSAQSNHDEHPANSPDDHSDLQSKYNNGDHQRLLTSKKNDHNVKVSDNPTRLGLILPIQCGLTGLVSGHIYTVRMNKKHINNQLKKLVERPLLSSLHNAGYVTVLFFVLFFSTAVGESLYYGEPRGYRTVCINPLKYGMNYPNKCFRHYPEYYQCDQSGHTMTEDEAKYHHFGWTHTWRGYRWSECDDHEKKRRLNFGLEFAGKYLSASFWVVFGHFLLTSLLFHRMNHKIYAQTLRQVTFMEEQHLSGVNPRIYELGIKGAK